MSYHRHQFSDSEPLTSLSSSFMDGLLDQRDKAATVTGWTIETNGGWKRLVVASAPAAATGWNVYLLDDKRDYRDRLWFWSGSIDLVAGTTRLLYPGHKDDTLYNAATLVGGISGRPYYTRLGYVSPGGATPDNAYFDLQAGAQPIVMWARDTDGALMCACNAGGTLAVGSSISILGTLFVSPILNVRKSPTVAGTSDASIFDAVNAKNIEPHDLNNLQDGQHMEQLPPGPASYPLGPILHGNPAVPYEWTVRGVTVRQRLLDPQLRRWVSFVAPATTKVLLDDDFDWRDRYLHAVMWFSNTVNRLPGQAGDTLNGTKAAVDVEGPWEFAVYTSAGGNIDHASIEGQLVVDPSTGYLYWDNTTGTAIAFANVFLQASPRLGPRSAGLPSPRLNADPTLGKVSGILTDSVSSGLSQVVARYRMDRGLVLDGGKIAGIADQSGNGHHLRQLDPSLRAIAPITRTALNNQLCAQFTGVEYYDSVKALPASTAGYYVAIVLEPTTTSIADFAPWRHLLPLSTAGQISAKLSGDRIDAQWLPNATATPPYLASVAPGVYTTGFGWAICWRFAPSGGLLVPTASITKSSAGGTTASAAVSVSPVGAADVQSLVWRFLEGFRGYVAEILVCAATQSTTQAFATSADVVTRYGF